MFGIAGDVVIVLLLVAANGLLAGSEIALVTARRARLRRRADDGDRGAAAALELLDSPGQFLSTVQIGITLVGIAAGAFGGARVAQNLAALLGPVGLGPAQAERAGIVLVVVAITFVTLVIGELVPKRLAMADPERISSLAARPMRALAIAAAPFVRILVVATDTVLRLVPVRPDQEPEVTEDEIRAMITQATATGVLEKTEEEIVDRLFRLSDQSVEALMTPRDRLVWLDLRAPPAEALRRVEGLPHTRYPVCDGALDRVRGYVSVQDLLHEFLAGRRPELRRLLRRPHTVPPATPAFRILERFQRSGDHIALVRHGRGAVLGLVTLNDLLAAMIGEVPVPFRLDVPGIVRRADGTCLVDGLLPYREFLRAFGRDAEPGAPAFPTVQAFVAARLDETPSPALELRWHGLRIEIVDMDGPRIDKVLVAEEPDAAPAGGVPSS